MGAAPDPPGDGRGALADALQRLTGCRTPLEFVGFAAFIAVFAAVLACFSLVDVYGQHFFQSGYGVAYNGARTILAAYLFWMFSFVGWVCLRRVVVVGTIAAVPLHERLALGFFTGAAVVSVAMLVFGYLQFYHRGLAALAAVAVVLASYREFLPMCREAHASIARFVRGSSKSQLLTSLAALLAIVVFGGLLFLVKGLYPQGGHDYYQHYSQYYAEVVDGHGIWPNRFWYHFYYSKGLGLVFLAMLLSDPLAPSLIASCFVAAAAIALYSLVGRFAPRSLWPSVAVVLYLALNVHTLGTGFYAANGGWGHFQKPHELNAALLTAILWMSANMVRAEGAARRVWGLAAAACSFISAYLLIVSPVIVGLFCVMAGAGFFRWRRDIALSFCGVAIAAGAGLVSVFLLNFLTTGIPSDLALEIWWPIIDFRRLNDAGTLFDVTNVAFRRAQAVAQGISFSAFDMRDFLKNISHFDVLASWTYGGGVGLVLVFGAAVLRARRRRVTKLLGTGNIAAGGVVLAFVAAATLFSVAIGAGEPVSYVRIASYSLPVMIALTAIIWQIAIGSAAWPRPARTVIAFLIPAVLAGATIAQAYDAQRATLLPVIDNAAKFADGRYSIYDAYRDQAGWPALPDRTAIYPAMYEAWKSIGPGRRLWSFNVHSYCMLPGCRLETHISSIMTARRAEILYGSPEMAQQILHDEGLDYFFIATRIDIRDPLICTPLFAPDTISKYMGAKWTDGSDALLTWKGPDVGPLSEEWVEKYRAALKSSPHTPDCTGAGPPFSYIGRRIHEDVMNGKRWGRDIVRPQ